LLRDASPFEALHNRDEGSPPRYAVAKRLAARSAWVAVLWVVCGAWSSVPVPGPTEGGSKRLELRAGEPLIPIALMQGRKEISFTARGRMRVRVGTGKEEKLLEAPAGAKWKVRVTGGRPATVITRLQLGEFAFADRKGLTERERHWMRKGLQLERKVIGTLYGFSGKVLDNRRTLLLLREPVAAGEISAKQAALLREHGAATTVFEELASPSTAILELVDAAGAVALLAEDALTVETLDDAGFDVQQVEFGVGYAFHGFEDRSYRGALRFTVDRQGLLALGNILLLEELLKGLVPSEIFPRAHPEALKAQAVTARGEVLAKLGIKHLTDPFPLCSEQHCAVYKGLTGEVASTSAAVVATRGQAVFSAHGKLVDSVYSAVCGGHTENNDAVWGGPPNPNLRGKPDLLDLRTPSPRPSKLDAFLTAPNLPAACRMSSFAQPGKFRWTKRLTAAEVDALVQPLNIGAVKAMAVSERGVSGRAISMTISGSSGAREVHGELALRRLFGMLNSSMFLVEPERGPEGQTVAWVFRGGGWGHGVGMCQTGAVARAEAGWDYRSILRHYFNGAQVAPLY
jgi:SpoIID/LytB domain protein